MHWYASGSRAVAFGFIALVVVGVSIGASAALDGIGSPDRAMEPSWCAVIAVPSTVLFEFWGWRCRAWRRLRIVDVPIIAGRYTGWLTPQDEHRPVVSVCVVIRQTFTRVAVDLIAVSESGPPPSRSISASVHDLGANRAALQCRHRDRAWAGIPHASTRAGDVADLEILTTTGGAFGDYCCARWGDGRLALVRTAPPS